MITVAIVAIIVGISVYVWKQRELSIQNKFHSTENSCLEQQLADAEWFAKGQDEQIARLTHTVEELRGTLARRKLKEAA